MISAKQDGPSLSTQIWSARTCEVGLVNGRQRWAAAAARCYAATWSTYDYKSLNHLKLKHFKTNFIATKKNQ